MNFRAEPCEKLHASDASPDDLAERRKEKHVRHDWRGRRTTEQCARRSSSRSTASFGAGLGHDVFIRFCSAQNFLELESLISLLRRVTREGIQARRLLVHVDSRTVLGAVLELRKQGFCCFAYDIALELVWVPTWANPADVPSRNKPIESWLASLPKLPPPPTAVFASSPCPSRSWICSVSQCRLRHTRQNMYASLIPLVPPVVRKCNHACAMTFLGESSSTPFRCAAKGRENRRSG